VIGLLEGEGRRLNYELSWEGKGLLGTSCDEELLRTERGNNRMKMAAVNCKNVRDESSSRFLG